MMKMTIVTDNHNKIMGAVQGHTLTKREGDMEATVSFPSDYKLHKVEVEDDMIKITEAAVLQERLLKYIPKC